MQPSLPSNASRTPRTMPRTALVASADDSFRQRLNEILTGLRWQVREATGGAEAWTAVEAALPEAFIVDSWLPDLSCSELLRDFKTRFPEVALLSSDGCVFEGSSQKPHRQELLYALRRSQETDCAAWNVAPLLLEPSAAKQLPPIESTAATQPEHRSTAGHAISTTVEERLPEFVGQSASMLEVCRRIRLVAPRSTPVLIEGPTGSGKELVAQALHRLSKRSRKPFVAINCAAIPEALLEAELFGHTRGAFTGAVQGRVGRIESADGGTLFLDEIGEMPLALQAKLLRFVESGELQRIGDNETLKVDVRILAATHRPLAQHAQTGAFRADLYYRLAVFLIRTPALNDHLEDLPQLVAHFLSQMGREAPVKAIEASALSKLKGHGWPGNVRELEHVLERAAILSGDEPMLTCREIDFGAVV